MPWSRTADSAGVAVPCEPVPPAGSASPKTTPNCILYLASDESNYVTGNAVDDAKWRLNEFAQERPAEFGDGPARRGRNLQATVPEAFFWHSS